MRLRIKTIGVVFVLLAFVACGKKWKKPVAIGVEFNVPALVADTTSTAGSVNTFVPQNGRFALDNLQIIGERVQGDDLNQTIGKSFEFQFDRESTLAYQIDIPQGTYTQLDFLFHLAEKGGGNGNNNIFLKGDYIDENLDRYKVQLRVDVTTILRSRAVDADNSEEIVLVADKGRTLNVHFEVEQWFSTITPQMWEDADRTGSSSNSVLRIDSQNNSDLYSLVVGQLGEAFLVKFE